MFVSALLPLLLVAVVPPPSLALLLPPEGNDYPLYDFPSVQYLPHNSVVEYQDPRLVDDERMEVATRSTHLPAAASDSSPAHVYPQSSSSSSLPCTAQDIATILNMDDLDKVIRIISKLEGKSVREILLKLAHKHGLHIKDKDIHGQRKPLLDMTAGRLGPGSAPSTDALRTFQLKDGPDSPQGPLLHLRRPSNDLDTPPGTHWHSLPEDEQLFDPVAVEVPAVFPRGLPASSLPRALLLVADASRNEVARTEVDLGPRMALLDVLTEAKSVYALNNGPYRHNPFAVKPRRLETEMCLGLHSVGHIRASPSRPIVLSVTRTRPLEQLVWESVCLPRASELLVRPGDVIVLAPR
nr:uncharacterized protein LOC123769657 [Procambarus clarkii]